MKNILKNNYNHTLKQGYSNPNLMYNLGLKHTLPKKQFSRKKKKKKKKKNLDITHGLDKPSPTQVLL
jgi:hypothetical protein